MTVNSVIAETGKEPEKDEDRSAGGAVYPITGSVFARITPEKTGCTVTVLQKDDPVYFRVCKTDPWDSKQIQGEIINASFLKLDPDRHPDKERYRVAFLNRFAQIKHDVSANPLMKRMLSDTMVDDLIEETESVVAYPGENTTFEITFRGKKLSFTAKEFAHRNSTALNEKYLNLFMKALDATNKQWQEIRNHWLDIVVAEAENAETGVDILIERLADALSGEVRIYDDADLVNSPDKGYYDRGSEAYCVQSSWISTFLEKYGAEKQKEVLAKELKKRKYTVGESKQMRFANVPGKRKYCWRFSKDFVQFPVNEDGRVRTLVEEVVSQGVSYDTRV